MAKKLRVGVVFGGESGEHEVSLAGAASVLAAIDRERFEPVPIGITREGRWLVGGDPLRALAAGSRGQGARRGRRRGIRQAVAGRARGRDHARRRRSSAWKSTEGLPPGLRERLDVVLIMLHGPHGEDGTIQGLLELAGLPYVGAGVLASAVGMDKVAMKDMFRAHGLPIVDYVAVKRHEWRREPAAVERAVAEALGFPCFVKPANLGSSVGISKVKAPEDLPAALALAAAARPPHPGRARRAGARGRGRRARQRPAAGLRPGRGLLRGRVVRLRDQVRRRPHDLQGAGAARSRGDPARARARPRGLPRHRLRGPRARGLLHRRRAQACSSTRSTPCPASPRRARIPSCGRPRASPTPS